MTRVTRNDVLRHDLRSPVIIERLRLGDHSLIDEIASRLYSKILKSIDAYTETIDDWEKRDEKLKWVLHSQVKILGDMDLCVELTNQLVDAEEARTCDLLSELMYGYHFFSHEASALFYDLEFPTWNLLDFLDPRHYYIEGEVSASVSNRLLMILQGDSWPQKSSLNTLWERFDAKGVHSETVQLTKTQMEEWLLCCQLYKLLIEYFYESANSTEALYAFHYSFSFAVRLLGGSLTLKLAIESLSNSFKESRHSI